MDHCLQVFYQLCTQRGCLRFCMILEAYFVSWEPEKATPIAVPLIHQAMRVNSSFALSTLMLRVLMVKSGALKKLRARHHCCACPSLLIRQFTSLKWLRMSPLWTLKHRHCYSYSFLGILSSVQFSPDRTFWRVGSRWVRCSVLTSSHSNCNNLH